MSSFFPSKKRLPLVFSAFASFHFSSLIIFQKVDGLFVHLKVLKHLQTPYFRYDFCHFYILQTAILQYFVEVDGLFAPIISYS